MNKKIIIGSIALVVLIAIGLTLYFVLSPTKCKPSCKGKSCGSSDGCGGKCRQQCSSTGQACTSDSSCPSGQTCNDGMCSSSSQGCTTDSSCPSGQLCDSGVCTPCTANCEGKECGDSDGCKGICQTGTCSQQGYACMAGKCTCQSDCTGKKCGELDNCGNPCLVGPCDDPTQMCQNGTCICAPKCSGKNCGDSDTCGGFCDGPCSNVDENCENKKCVTCPAEINCLNVCGTNIPDGCGKNGICGGESQRDKYISCPSNSSCQTNNFCSSLNKYIQVQILPLSNNNLTLSTATSTPAPNTDKNPMVFIGNDIINPKTTDLVNKTKWEIVPMSGNNNLYQIYSGCDNAADGTYAVTGYCDYYQGSGSQTYWALSVVSNNIICTQNIIGYDDIENTYWFIYNLPSGGVAIKHFKSNLFLSQGDFVTILGVGVLLPTLKQDIFAWTLNYY